MHFWLGWGLGLAITVTSILFEVAFLPGVRIWYNQQMGKEFATKSTGQEANFDDGPITFPNGSDNNDSITSFMAKLNVSF